MSQYIGKTIALISNTDNRYVGLLESIDSEKGVVTLRQVRCFGTEGRKGWGPEEIYPNPNVYDVVSFNGNDVKDLNILDVPLEQVQPIMAPQAATAAQAPPQAASQGPSVPAAVAGYGVYAPEKDQQQQEQPHTQMSSSEKQQKPQRQHAERQPVVNESAGTPSVVPNSDFDFESNNAKFQSAEKPTDGDLEKEKQAAKTDEVFYDKKSSFFDSISSSAAETSGSSKWQEERQTNMDTFGQARPKNSNYGRFRGNRGGNRGGARGGARGGYRSDNREKRGGFNTPAPSNIEF